MITTNHVLELVEWW